MSAINPEPVFSPDTAERPRYGRIETYSHSDSITQNKGAAMVTVISDSEAGARTREFVKFTGLIAKYAYASSATCWFDIVQAYPTMLKELNDIRIALGEDIHVSRVVVMKL